MKVIISLHYNHEIIKITQGYIKQPYLLFPLFYEKLISVLIFPGSFILSYMLYILFKLLTVAAWRLISRNVWPYRDNK